MGFSPKLLLLWMVFFMLSLALPALFAPKKFIAVLDKTLKNSDIVRVWWFLTMIIWLFFLAVHWKFGHRRLLIFPVFGWLSLIKWLFLLWFPVWWQSKYKFFYAKPLQAILLGLGILLFCLFLLRIAYFKI